jgi:hypothetical protein
MKQCFKGSLLRVESADALPDSDKGLLHGILRCPFMLPVTIIAGDFFMIISEDEG